MSYRLVPIGGYSELEAKRDEALASEEVCLRSLDRRSTYDRQLHTLILLSLGSLLPLTTYFTLPKTVQLHIIDSHRPWNLSNLFGVDLDDVPDGEIEAGPSSGQGRIWVWGDGEEGGLGQVKKSWEALEYEPSDSESGSDEDDEGSDDEAEDGEEEEEGNDDEEAEGDDDEGLSRGLGKRVKGNGDVNGKKKRRKEHEDGDQVSCDPTIMTDSSHCSHVACREPSERHTTIAYSGTTSPVHHGVCPSPSLSTSSQQCSSEPTTTFCGTPFSVSHISMSLHG